MAKKKRTHLSVEEKQNILSKIESHAQENNCSIRQAEMDLGLKANIYHMYKRTAGPKVVVYKNKKKEKPVKRATKAASGPAKMTLVMGTPDQIRELLRGQ